VLTEEIHDTEWKMMAHLAQNGVEWFPQAFTAHRSIYFHHPAGQPYTDDEAAACFAQAHEKFDRYAIPVSRSMAPHFGEYSRNTIPLAKGRGVRFCLSGFLPNEAYEGEHLDWEPGPYAHSGYGLDDLFGSPDLFVATARPVSPHERRMLDPASTRYAIV
jgi:hypothetical protein